VPETFHFPAPHVPSSFSLRPLSLLLLFFVDHLPFARTLRSSLVFQLDSMKTWILPLASRFVCPALQVHSEANAFANAQVHVHISDQSLINDSTREYARMRSISGNISQFYFSDLRSRCSPARIPSRRFGEGSFRHVRGLFYCTSINERLPMAYRLDESAREQLSLLSALPFSIIYNRAEHEGN